MASKQVFIEALKEGDKVTDFFIVQASAVRESKTGSKFLALTIADRTGNVDAKAWDYKQETAPEVGQYVKIEAKVEKYKDKLQLVMSRVRVAESSEVAVEDYLPTSDKDRTVMLKAAYDWAEALTDKDLSDTVLRMMQSCNDLLRNAPAAKGMHQAYIGGLLEHTHQLCLLSMAVCDAYPSLNRDLMISACLVHDIGKVYELCFETHIGNTLRGRLVGHIVIGLQMFDEHRVDRATRDNPTLNHLEHIITSHHGKLDWGSPVIPMTREAIVFHQLDMIDSRMSGLDNAEKDPSRDEEGFVRAKTLDGGFAWFQPTTVDPSTTKYPFTKAGE